MTIKIFGLLITLFLFCSGYAQNQRVTPSSTHVPLETLISDLSKFLKDSSEILSGKITPKVTILLNANYQRVDYQEGWNIAQILTPQIQASSASEVKTLICINEERTLVGRYYNGSEGYNLRWKVQIITLPEGRLIYKGIMTGNDPLFILYRSTRGLPVYGSEPRGKFFQVIRDMIDTPIPVLADAGDLCTMALSPDGNSLASGGRDDLITLWDLKTSKKIGTLKGHTSTINSTIFSPDGKLIASGSYDQTIRIWEVATGKEVYTLRGHTNDIWGVVISPDGKLVASGSDDGTIRLWDVKTGSEVRRLIGNPGYAKGLAFSPDGKHVASGDSYKGIKLWDVITGKEISWIDIRGYNQRYRINDLAFSPNGKILATGGQDGAIRLCNLITGKELRGLFDISSSVKSVSFSPDGKILASGWEDATIRLMDVATRKEVRQLKWHTDSVNRIVFSADGKLLVSGSRDGTVRVWDLSLKDF